MDLLVMYPHMRDVVVMARALLTSKPDNLVFTGKDRGSVWRPTPWMTNGDIMDVMNNVLLTSETEGVCAARPAGFRIRDVGAVKKLSGRRGRRCWDQRYHGRVRGMIRRR